ncbi:MAG: hypothetical protein V1886_02345 [archaeon]
MDAGLNAEPLSREEIQKILDDNLRDKIIATIEQGYRIRFPRAEFSMPENCLLLIYSFKDIKKIPDEQLGKIISGAEKIEDSNKKLIDEWYNISTYRYFNEINRLDSAITLAQSHGFVDIARKMKKKLKEWNDKLLWLDMNELLKKQLEYYYNEKGDRLDNLNKIINGDTTGARLRFGCIEAFVPLSCYNEGMLSQSYEANKGFFKDLKNAYKFAEELRGNWKISKSAGIAYTDEVIECWGSGFVKAAGRKIGLEAKIRKNGMMDEFDCLMRTQHIPIKREEVLKKGRTLLYDYGFRELKKNFVAVKDESTFTAFYSSCRRFQFMGTAEEMESEVPRFLEAVLD